MALINAQTGNGVNAYSGNSMEQNVCMGKKTEHPPSAFWRRLSEALAGKSRWEPVNANNVANVLRMSQGSVHRWYKGEGLPELTTALDLAKEGGVCVDWLLNNVKPKYPISKDPILRELFETCEDLDEQARKRVLRAARGELLQKNEDRGIERAQIS